jgi:hypothetical protein
MADQFVSFDMQAIDQAIETAQRHAHSLRAQSGHQPIGADDGELKVSAQCVSVSVDDGKVCLNLPLGLGSYCFTVPSWVPNGAEVRACLDICTVWGIPCGVEVTLSFNGQQIIKKGFGCC